MSQVNRAVRTHEGVSEELPVINVKDANTKPAAHPAKVEDHSNDNPTPPDQDDRIPTPGVHGGLAKPGIHQHAEYVKPKLDSASVDTTKTNH